MATNTDNTTPWTRSKNNNNHWRRYKGLTLTVFRDRFGTFKYCIADADGPRYSNRRFYDHEEAMAEAEMNADIRLGNSV